MSLSVLLMFSSKSFIVFSLTFRFLIHFGSESHARRVSFMQRAEGHSGSSAGVSWSQDVSECVCWVVQGEREEAKKDTFP